MWYQAQRRDGLAAGELMPLPEDHGGKSNRLTSYIYTDTTREVQDSRRSSEAGSAAEGLVGNSVESVG